MKNEFLDQWLEFSKSAAEPMMRLNEISAKAMEQVARQQMDLARDYMDLGTRNLKLLGESKDPQKLVADQGQLVTEFGQKLMGRAEEFMKIATEAQTALTTWAEEAAKKAAAATQPAAKKTG